METRTEQGSYSETTKTSDADWLSKDSLHYHDK